MTSLIRALRAEIQKLNRTLVLAIVVLAPLGTGAMLFFNIIRSDNDRPDPWNWMMNATIFVWGYLALPLFIVLETALLTGLDHNANGWKHLYALPIPRWTIYVAKLIIMLVITLISTLLMVLVLWLVGMFSQLIQIKPEINFLAPLPWGPILAGVLVSYFASWLIMAIHLWIGMYFSNFTIPVGIGLVAVVASALGVNNIDWAYAFPWTLSGITLRQVYEYMQQNLPNVIPVPTLLLGMVGGIVVAAVGCWFMLRQDVLS